MDKIILEGLRLMAVHGVLPQEHAIAQPFVLDLELQLNTAVAGRSDCLADTVDYAAVCATATQVLTGRHYNLLEALAEDCAAALLQAYPLAAVKVRLAKLHAPVGVALERVTVEIVRPLGAELS
jgi:dihydroneopterin aldolase